MDDFVVEDDVDAVEEEDDVSASESESDAGSATVRCVRSLLKFFVD
jgi:hypothetical protein